MKSIIFICISFQFICFNCRGQLNNPPVLSQLEFRDSAENAEYVAFRTNQKKFEDSSNLAYKIKEEAYKKANLADRVAKHNADFEKEDNYNIPNQYTPQKPWAKLGMDSAKFTKMYGTEFQYKYQDGIENNSSHKTLFIWSGAQYMYLADYALFLGGELMRYNITLDYSISPVTIVATPKIYQGNRFYKVVTKAYYNAKGQITKATITGPVDDLIKIFCRYWELTPVSYNELHTKHTITKEFVSDKIALSLVGNGALITITKNENAVMDLFKF